MIFDSHAHYDDKAFDPDREILLSSLAARGIEKIVNSGASINSTKKTIELAEKYLNIYAAVGIHPTHTDELTEEHIQWLKDLLSHPKAVALGEIGLDYYWDDVEREVQKKWFVRQLNLARECGKPVIIHSRDAAKDTVDIMNAEKAGEIGGVIHCYSYTKETARDFLNMDYYFGIGGVLTFNNAKKLKEAVEYIPLDKIVLETDCPYLSPVPNRGKRNSSLNLPYVVTVLAEIKGISEEEVRRIVWENSVRLYRM